MKTCRILILFFLVIGSLSTLTAEGLIFSDNGWELGRVPEGPEFQKTLSIENTSGEAVELQLTSTCSCMRVHPASAILPPGESLSVELLYLTAGEYGDFRKFLMILTSLPELPKLYYPVTGTVAAQDSPDSEPPEEETIIPWEDLPESVPPEDRIALYYSPGCRSCHRLFEEYLPRLRQETGEDWIVGGIDVMKESGYRRYLALLEEQGASPRALPAVLIKGILLQGEAEIENSLLQAASGTLDEVVSAEDRSEILLGIVPVFAAGLLDGVNPCAFSSLLFLLSALAVAGRSRRQILHIGLWFSLSVFLAYFLIGLGFFSLVRAASYFPVVAEGIRWVLAGVLVLFAVLSLFDYRKIRNGEPEKILLQLPGTLKRRLHRSVRNRVKSASLILSAITMGFLVSIFELACTGQVYLPTIIYMIRVQEGIAGYLYLLLYNLGFVIPLLIVFALAYRGITSRAVTGFFQKRMGTVKLLTAGLFVLLAVITLLT